MREGSLQFVQLLFGGILPLQLQHALQQINHRIESAILIIGQAPALELSMRLARHMRFDLLHQARFANPRLATEHHHLPHPLPYLRPALQQQPHLLLPAYQRRQLIVVFLLFEHPVHVDRLRQTSEGVSAQRLAMKPPLNQLISDAADDYGIGLGELLQPGRKVQLAQNWRFAPCRPPRPGLYGSPGVHLSLMPFSRWRHVFSRSTCLDNP